MSHIAVASALKQTQHVYCQTETVRQRFSHVFDYPLEQLFLFPPTFSLPAEAETPAVFQVTSEHDTSFKLFFPSGCYPHKNHSILIAVFSQFADELKDVTCFLTVSPQGNALEKKLASDIVQKGLSKKIILMGTIPFEHMGYYYQKTDAVIFPSLLETVGLGQIEGMHYSRPILTADYDWAHEVCDEAALYFDPLDPQDIKEKILQLKNDIALQEHLATKGKERVQGFFKSWPEIIKNVLENEGVEYQR